MSYTISFTDKSQKLDEPTFNKYFEDRQHYELVQGEWVYLNSDTDVDFGFEYFVNEDEGSIASFNINLMRPHTYALEADIELEAFTDKFDLRIIDYQSTKSDEAKYSSEAFIKTWDMVNSSSIVGIKTIQSDADFYTLPRDIIKKSWQWNYDKRKLIKEMHKQGEELFAPKIMYGLDRDGVTKTFIVSTDLIPCVLPSFIDSIVIQSWELSNHQDINDAELYMVDKADIEKYLVNYPTATWKGIKYHKLDYQDPPQEFIKLIREENRLQEFIRLDFAQIFDDK